MDAQNILDLHVLFAAGLSSFLFVRSISHSERIQRLEDITGTIGNNTSTGITILSNGGVSGAFANAIVNTLIDAIAVNNDTQKTAMYNAIKSMNNNAF